MFRRTRRPAVITLGALLLSLVVAGQVLAAHSWSGRIPLTSSGGGFAFGVAGLNSTTAVGVYVEWNGSRYDVTVRRSTTSGASWDAPVMLSTNGYDAAISASDPYVDVIWTEHGRIRYARSDDGGVSFDPSVALTGRGFPLDLSVAREPGGLVIVAWQNGTTDAIKTRVSTNGGVSFGPVTTFSSHIQDMGTTVAAGDGVVYLAYKTNPDRIVVRRSTNGGTNWSSAKLITTQAYGVYDNVSLTASGTHAYLAFTGRNTHHSAWGAVDYRLSKDSGASWSVPFKLAPGKWKTETPEVSLQGGVVRAVYERRTSSGYGVYYQQSSNGMRWSSPELVESTGFGPHLTKAGNIVVLYTTPSEDAYARTGS